jgi:prepilin-type N-terminal cleavage/methylation domain-containing protein
MDELRTNTTSFSLRGREPQRRSGFTLVELMIATVILAGGLLTMATVQIQSMQGGQRGRHLSQASVIAASQLERLQRMRWTSIPATGWTAPITADNIVSRADVDQPYAVSWRITNLTANSTRTLDVSVSWTEPSGQNRTVTMSSIRNNHEAL